jgi:hypothetical protein
MLDGASPVELSVADIDGDGRRDAVILGERTGVIPIGDDGAPGAYRYLCPGSDQGPVVGFAMADFNSDGISDMAYGDEYWLRVRLGVGGGLVDSAVNVIALPRVSSLAAGHANGDGHLDLVCSNGYQVALLPGSGDGSFASQVVLGAGGWHALAADLEGDGDVDVVSGEHVYLGHGEGTFESRPPLGLEAAALADLDRDGMLDVIGIDAGTVCVRLGEGDGNFGARNDYSVPESPYDVVVGDVNGDGWPDAVVGSRTVPVYTVLLGGPGGRFPEAPQVPGLSSPVSVVALDADLDGWTDLVVAERGARRITLMHNNGDRTFDHVGAWHTGAGLGPITTADYNRDGWPDVVAADDSSSTLMVLLGNGGGFAPGIEFPTIPQPVAVEVGDVTGDGLLDVVAAGVRVALHRGDGAGGLLPAGEGGLLERANDVLVWDYDPDPGLEVLVPGGLRPAHTEASLYDFDPARGFHSDGGFSLPLTLRIEADDLDGDGDADVVSAGRDTTPERLRGRVAFRVGIWPSSFDVGPDPAALALKDMDGDGHLDVVTASPVSNAVTVWRGDGTGSLHDRWDFGVAAEPSALAVADLDRDGDLDAAVACRRGGALTLLWNQTCTDPTPVLVSLVEAHRSGGRVALVWRVSGTAREYSVVWREDGSEWSVASVSQADGSGTVRHDGPDPHPSARLAFGLRSRGDPVGPAHGETWLDPAEAARFSLLGSQPNPSLGILQIGFVLPEPAPVDLELYDLSGRLLIRRHLDGLGAGRQVVALDESARLSAGFYVVRLIRAGQALTTRVALVR